MNSAPDCPKCGVLTAIDLEPAPLREAYRVIFKDWRTWATVFGVTLGLGVIVGSLHLPTASVGAGAGGFIGIYLGVRVSKMRRCRRCGALAS